MDNVSNYKSFILNVLITSTQMAMEKKIQMADVY